MTTTVTLAARSTATLDAPALHATGGRVAVTDVAGVDLTLEACVVPWGVTARVTDDGRTFYDEQWQPGSLVPDDRVVIYDGHVPAGGGPGQLNGDRVPIGRAHTFTERADGMYATLTLANTARGRDVYELARTLGYVDVSLEAAVPVGASGTVARTAADPCPLTGLAVVLPPFRGAYAGAVAAGRSDPAASDTGDDDDQDDDDVDDTGDDDAGQQQGSAGRAAARPATLEDVRREVARYGGVTGQRDRQATPFDRFRSFDEMVVAARSGRRTDQVELSRQFTTAYRAHRDRVQLAATVGRAWVDQVTADNPGLLPPSWLTQVFGIIDEGRPSIVATGGPRDPGDSGLDVYWPYYDGDLRAIVQQQAVEKTEINSVKVSFKRGQATLETYAGGSDVSYQLQRRSTPGYMSLYDRVLQIAFGLRTEIAFTTELLAGATGTVPWDPDAADPQGAGLRAALFAASSAVRQATGQPATVVLAATDMFVALGSAPWAMPAVYGVMNVSGTAQASTLRINVSGLEITEAPDLPDGTVIVTNTLAASWFEEGPFLVTAEDVAKLGTDVAIWGMGTSGLFTPAGVVKLTDPTALAATSSTSKKAAASS